MSPWLKLIPVIKRNSLFLTAESTEDARRQGVNWIKFVLNLKHIRMEFEEW